MPRLIFKCPYMKPCGKKNRGGFAEYVATRDGVEILPETARGGYAGYMAGRKGSHGMFGAGDTPPVLSQVMEEISNHPGNIWTPIISLKREDAVRLGFDNAERWRQLTMAHADELAAALKISPNNFVLYGAFHHDDVHPHMHMVCYSKNPREGFLTEKGIENIRSTLARDIFQHDLMEIYQEQTQTRQDTGDAAREALRQVLADMKYDMPENENIAILMRQLMEKLQTYKGKMVYGYLPRPAKALVNAIVDELAAEPHVAMVYAKWCELRQDVFGAYKDAPVDIAPLSQNEAFKPVRNMVVKEAAALLEMLAEVEVGQNHAEDIHSPDGTTSSAPSMSPIKQPDDQAEIAATLTSMDASVLAASARLLGGISKIFETVPVYKKVPHQHMDRKRKRQLQQQRDGNGIETAEQQQNAPTY